MPEKLKEKENIIFEKNSQSPIKQQKNSSSPFDVTKLKYKNVQSLKQNENFEDVPNNLKQNEVNSYINFYKLLKNFLRFMQRNQNIKLKL